MINPEDEIIVDSRSSCTKDEAAAKLLGWMQGTIRKKYIKVTEHGIPADQLAHLHSLDGSLSDQLVALREPARRLLSKAAKGSKEFSKMNEAVKDIDEVIKKAMSYLLDIDDELDKGENSALKIDHEATNKTGVIHIKLRSLDKWARLKYGIRILENSASNSVTAKPSDHPTSSLVKWLRTIYYMDESAEAGFKTAYDIALRHPSSGKAASGQALLQPILQAQEDKKPWLIPGPLDPPTKNDWYPAARYFARQLIKTEPKLKKNKGALAKKVRASMVENNVCMRGGEKQPSPDTIRNALVGIKFK